MGLAGGLRPPPGEPEGGFMWTFSNSEWNPLSPQDSHQLFRLCTGHGAQDDILSAVLDEGVCSGGGAIHESEKCVARLVRWGVLRPLDGRPAQAVQGLVG